MHIGQTKNTTKYPYMTLKFTTVTYLLSQEHHEDLEHPLEGSPENLL